MSKIDIVKMIELNPSKYDYTAYEFPKGRKKNATEDETVCAIREFKEETGYIGDIILDLNNFIDSSEKYVSVIFLTNISDLKLRLQGKLNSAIQISSDTMNHEWLRAFFNGVMTSPEWRASQKKEI